MAETSAWLGSHSLEWDGICRGEGGGMGVGSKPLDPKKGKEENKKMTSLWLWKNAALS